MHGNGMMHAVLTSFVPRPVVARQERNERRRSAGSIIVSYDFFPNSKQQLTIVTIQSTWSAWPLTLTIAILSDTQNNSTIITSSNRVP